MKTIVAMLAIAFLVALPSRGQGTMQTYMAVGPGSGDSTYTSFLQNMMATMRGTSLAPVPFLPNGANIGIADIVTYDPNGTGSSLFTGFSVSSSSLFTVNQVTRSQWTSDAGHTNAITASSFGQALIGIRWGPNGPGDQDTIYTSGSTSGVQLNGLIGVTYVYTTRLSAGQTIEDAKASFNVLYNGHLPIAARHSLSSLFGGSMVNVHVPEPSALALLGLSAALFWQKRGRFDL